RPNFNSDEIGKHRTARLIHQRANGGLAANSQFGLLYGPIPKFAEGTQMLSRKPPSVDRMMCGCQGPCDGHNEAAGARSRGDEMFRLSRRHLLRTSIAGAAAGILTSAGIELASPRSAFAQSTLSPEA